MRLLLDLGNSRLKWATAAEHDVLARGVVDYRQVDPLATLEQALVNAAAPLQTVACSSVGPKSVQQRLADWANDQLGLTMTMARSESRFGSLRNGYRAASQLGVDRWLAMIGGWQQFRQALCIVDAGTACTVDWVDDEGQHLGGWIAPSQHLMVEALNQNTEQISAERGDAVAWGRATSEAVAAGVAACWRGLLQVLQRQLNSALPTARVVVTGGNSDGLLEMLPKASHRPNLVLDGLDIWFNEQVLSTSR